MPPHAHNASLQSPALQVGPLRMRKEPVSGARTGAVGRAYLASTTALPSGSGAAARRHHPSSQRRRPEPHGRGQNVGPCAATRAARRRRHRRRPYCRSSATASSPRCHPRPCLMCCAYPPSLGHRRSRRGNARTVLHDELRLSCHHRRGVALRVDGVRVRTELLGGHVPCHRARLALEAVRRQRPLRLYNGGGGGLRGGNAAVPVGPIATRVVAAATAAATTPSAWCRLRAS